MNPELASVVLQRTRAQLAEAMAKIAELEAIIALHNAKTKESEQTAAVS